MKLIEKKEDMQILNYVQKFIEKWSPVFLVMAYIVHVRQINGIQLNNPGYELSTYLLNYSDGFGSRLLVGSLMQFFFDGKVSYERIMEWNEVIMLLNSLLTITFMTMVSNTFKEKKYKILCYVFMVMFFFLPSTTIYIGAYIGRLDLYLLFTGLLCVFILNQKKGGILCYVFTVILCAAGILIHQGFLFTYFVPVFISLMWRILREDCSKKSVIKTVLVLLPLVVLFFYLQLFSHLKYTSLEETMAVCATRTEDDFSELMLKQEYFMSLKELMIDLGFSHFSNAFVDIIHTLLSLFPLWIVLGAFWILVFRFTKDKRRKIVYVFMQLCFLIYVPLFMFMIDYGRWYTALEISAMANLWIAIYNRDEAVEKALDKLYNFFSRYPGLVCLGIAYLLQMEYHNIGF